MFQSTSALICRFCFGWRHRSRTECLYIYGRLRFGFAKFSSFSSAVMTSSTTDYSVASLAGQIRNQISQIQSLKETRDRDLNQLMRRLTDTLCDPMCHDDLLFYTLRNLPTDLQDVVWAAVLHHDRWSEFQYSWTYGLMLTFSRAQFLSKSLDKDWEEAWRRQDAFPHFNTFVLMLSGHVARLDMSADMVFKMLHTVLAVGVPNAAVFLDVTAKHYSDSVRTLRNNEGVLRVCVVLMHWRFKHPAAMALLERFAVVVKDRPDEFQPSDLIHAAGALTLAGLDVSHFLEDVDRILSKCVDQLSNRKLEAVCTACQHAGYQVKYTCIANALVSRIDSLPELTACLKYLATHKPTEMEILLQTMQADLKLSNWPLNQLSKLMQSLSKEILLAHHSTLVLPIVEKIATFLDRRLADIPPPLAARFLYSFGHCRMVTRPWYGLLDRLAIHSCSSSSFTFHHVLWLLAGLCAVCESSAAWHASRQLQRVRFVREEFSYSGPSHSSVVGGLSMFVKMMSRGCHIYLQPVKKHGFTANYIEHICRQLRILRLSAAKDLLSSLALYAIDDLNSSHKLTPESCHIAYTLSWLGYDGSERFLRLFCDRVRHLQFSHAKLNVGMLCKICVACVLYGYFPKHVLGKLFKTVCESYTHGQGKDAIYGYSHRLLWLSTLSRSCNGPVLNRECKFAVMQDVCSLHGYSASTSVRIIFEEAFSAVHFNLPTVSLLRVTAVLCFDQYGRLLPKDFRLPVSDKVLLKYSAEYLRDAGIQLLVFLLPGDTSLPFKAEKPSLFQAVHSNKGTTAAAIGMVQLLLYELNRQGIPVVVCAKSQLLDLPSRADQVTFLTSLVPPQFHRHKKRESIFDEPLLY